MDVIQQVNSNANKALLWSLLTEERVFAGLSDSSLQPVMTLFETAIHTTINSYAQDNSFEKQNSSPQMVLSTLNKEVIKRDMTDLKVSIKSVDDKMSQHYISRDEFEPIKKIVYGLVTLILIGVVVALLSLVVKK